MLLESIARHSLVVSPKALRLNTEGFRSPQAPLSIHLRDAVSRHDGVLPNGKERCLMEKLSVVLWGMSISAEGLWAIAATIIIVGIVAAVVMLDV